MCAPRRLGCGSTRSSLAHEPVIRRWKSYWPRSQPSRDPECDTFATVPGMRVNRSVPPCSVIPVLMYPDPGAAADWLSKAFGFTVRLRIANHRVQMKAGDGCFTIAEGSVVPNNSQIVQVRIEDADGHCER